MTAPIIVSRATPAALALPILVLLLAALPCSAQPDSAPPAPDPVDVEVIILAGGDLPDRISVSYGQPLSEEQVRDDFRVLARMLNQASVTPRYRRGRRFPGAEVSVEAQANLSGLVNWQAGQLNLDALVQTYRRYRHTAATFIFETPFQLTWPKGSATRGPLRWQQTGNHPSTVTYHIWIDQSRGVPQSLPVIRQGGIGWAPVVGIGLIALVAGIGVFWIAHRVLRQRRAAQPANEESA